MRSLRFDHGRRGIGEIQLCLHIFQRQRMAIQPTHDLAVLDLYLPTESARFTILAHQILIVPMAVCPLGQRHCGMLHHNFIHPGRRLISEHSKKAEPDPG